MIEITDNQMRVGSWLLSIAIVIACIFMNGCSSMEIITTDTIEIPGNTIVKEFNSPSEYPKEIRDLGVNGFTYLYPTGLNVIYTIKGNACILEHEVKHVEDGSGHDGWPKRLMECKA